MADDGSRWTSKPSVRNDIIELETVPCGNCGSGQADTLFFGRDRLTGLPGQFRLVRCRTCGLIRQNPRPTPASIALCYPDTYEPFSRAITDEPGLWRRWDRGYGMRKRRHLIERLHKSGRLLDVGCATGNFLHAMQQSSGWDVTGIEPSAYAARYAQQRLGLDVRQGNVSSLEFPDQSFDVITLWNVLEHLHDPVGDLRRLLNWLQTGGHLVFSIPNVESFETRLFGERWFGWDLPRHLYFFPRPVLDRILNNLGLVVVERTCLSGAQISFVMSLDHYHVGADGSPAWYRVITALLKTVPSRIVLSPLFYVVDRLQQSTNVTYVARKVRI